MLTCFCAHQSENDQFWYLHLLSLLAYSLHLQFCLYFLSHEYKLECKSQIKFTKNAQSRLFFFNYMQLKAQPSDVFMKLSAAAGGLGWIKAIFRAEEPSSCSGGKEKPCRLPSQRGVSPTFSLTNKNLDQIVKEADSKKN